MVDLIVVKEAYDRGEINEIGWILSEFNIPDAMKNVFSTGH